LHHLGTGFIPDGATLHHPKGGPIPSLHHYYDCIDKTDSDSLLEDIFGSDGLLHADDIIYFETKCSDIEEKSKALSSSFHRYFDTRLKGNIKHQWEEGLPSGYFD